MLLASIACQLGVATRPDFDSTAQTLPVGTRIELLQDIQIRAGRARVHLQEGRAGYGFDQYAPSCTVEIDQFDQQQAHTVPAGSYRVVRVQPMWEEVVQAGHVLLAGPWGPLSRLDSGPSMIYRGYHFWVDPGRHPNLRRFTCRGALDDPPYAYPPSINQILRIFGGMARVDLPEPAADADTTSAP